MFNAETKIFKEINGDEMRIRITYVDGRPQILEHLVDGHAVTATRFKPLDDKMRVRLDTERNSGIVLNPCEQLIRVFELMTA